MDNWMDIRIKIISQIYLMVSHNYNNNFFKVLKKDMNQLHKKRKLKKIEIISKNYWIKVEQLLLILYLFI